jgi:hypothetical protein
MNDASEATTFTIPKIKVNLKTIGAVLLLLGFTNIGDLFKTIKGIFVGEKISPALAQEIATRKVIDSILTDTLQLTRYELKKVNKRDLRFKAIQLQADPKLRQAVERSVNESTSEKRKREQDEKLLEGLSE